MSVTVAAKVIVCRPADSEVTTRLPRDHYVRPNGNDYSVHPAVIGRRVQVCADLDRVQGMCDDKTVADHERIWATHQTISDPAHGEAAILLRRTRIGALRPSAQSDVEVRARTGYDAALGVDLHGGVA